MERQVEVIIKQIQLIQVIIITDYNSIGWFVTTNEIEAQIVRYIKVEDPKEDDIQRNLQDKLKQRFQDIFEHPRNNILFPDQPPHLPLIRADQHNQPIIRSPVNSRQSHDLRLTSCDAG